MTWLIFILGATKLVPAGIGLYYYKILSKPLQAFVILMVAGALNETVLLILAKTVGNNLYMLHVFAAVELAVLLYFFYLELRDQRVKRLIPWIGSVAIACGIVYALMGNNLLKYPSEPRAINAIIIIIACLYLFYEMVVLGDSADPLRDGKYFINGAVLLYFSATFITWLAMKYVITDTAIVYALYGSHAYINAFCNLVFAYGLWISSKSSLSLS
jgi:hypothetical protein